MLARLGATLDEAGVIGQVPVAPRRHLLAMGVLVDKHRRDVRHEVRCIEDELRTLSIPVLLVKGAAYVAADLPLSRHRLFHDVDIMVPRDRLSDVEQRLRRAGWASAKSDTYDQTYYRRWSHELPPFVHAVRGTTLDVHHTILPPTATPVPDPDKLMAAARRVHGRVKVLEPVDMFLHSATHLFHEGEFDHGFRDLMDLRDLLECFADEEAFAPRLVRRAREFGLERIVHHALHLVECFFGPDHVPRVRTGGEMGPAARRMMAAAVAIAAQLAYRSLPDSAARPQMGRSGT